LLLGGLAAFILLDLLALLWGADSRDWSSGDETARHGS
jgi:hypothetical protein